MKQGGGERVIAGRYRLDRQIGEGGMGSVFAGFDLRLERPVAVKVLHGLRGKDSDVRFAREARVAAQVHSPHVIAIYDVGTDDGEPYLVQELLTGVSLDALLAGGGQLDPPRAVRLAVQVCKALSTIHERGLVHRDIKPSNLFLAQFEDGAERIVLLDFGIVKNVTERDEAMRTGTGMVLGTPAYMSPEQARADVEIDPRTDLFSLGATLFQMLSGSPPFHGAGPIAVLSKILLEDVHFPEGCASPELEAVILRCLSKVREERYRSAAALMEALLSTPEAGGTAARAAPLESADVLTTLQRPPELCVMVVAGEPRARDPSAATIDSPIAVEEDALRRVAAWHGAKSEALDDGGLVAWFTGEGIPADHAAQAARCALALHALLEGRSLALARGRGEVAGRLPAGEALDRATQMLCAAAGARRIAVDEVMAGLLVVRFEVVGDALGFALRAEREVLEGTRMLLGKPIACVGRDREIAALLNIFAECTEEPVARATLVTGPAGIGKSRLAHEFVERLRRDHAALALWVGRGEPSNAGSPFHLLGQLLRSAAGAKVAEPLAVCRAKLRALVARHVEGAGAARVAEFLGEIMGAPFPDEGRTELRAARADAVLMGDQMRAAWDDLLSAECAGQPILIVIEDLHWVDLPSVRLLDAALRSQRDQPLMVLALGRPDVHERFPRLWVDRGVQEIRLSELSRKASERLVRQVLGKETPAELVERVVRQGDGNALYLEELSRAAAQGRETQIPLTVLAMVQARLDAFPPSVRRVLRAASVFGEVFWIGGVVRLIGDAKRVDDCFRELVTRELIIKRSESRFPGEDEYAFRHGLTRDAAYAMLTEEDRRLGHRLAATWLTDVGETEAAVLAKHRASGGEPERPPADRKPDHIPAKPPSPPPPPPPERPPRGSREPPRQPRQPHHQALQRYLEQAGLALRDGAGPLLAIDRAPDCRLPLPRLSAVLLEAEGNPLSMQTMATVVFQKQASPLYSLEGTPDEPHHVLALFGSPPGVGVYREWHELATRRHVHVSPVSPSALRAAVEEGRAAAHLLELVRRSRHDPFELEGRVATDIDFFGSRDELRTFLHQIDGVGAGIGLFGLEKWGTTSLLLRFRAEIGDRISAWVDLAALPSLSLASVLSAIHDDLTHALRDKTQPVRPPFADVEDALRWLVEIGHTIGGARPVIFLDRADELSRAERCPPEGLIDISRALYRLAFPQIGRAGAVLVFGGREDHIVASRRIGTHNNPLSGVVAVRYAPFFAREEMGDFMQRLGALCGLSFNQAALHRAFALTGGHKYLTRRLGSLLYQRQTSGAPLGVEVTPDLVSACATTLLTRHHSYFEAVVQTAPPALREVLAQLAVRPGALSELLGVVPLKDSRDTLAALKFADDYRLVTEEEGRYRLTVGLFKEWLQLTHDPERKPEHSTPPPPPLHAPPSQEEIHWLEERIREGFSSPHDLEMLARRLRIAAADAIRSSVPLRLQISDLVDWAVKNRRFWDLRDAVRELRPKFFDEGVGHTIVMTTGIGASGRRSGQGGQSA